MLETLKKSLKIEENDFLNDFIKRLNKTEDIFWKTIIILIICVTLSIDLKRNNILLEDIIRMFELFAYLSVQ